MKRGGRERDKGMRLFLTLPALPSAAAQSGRSEVPDLRRPVDGDRPEPGDERSHGGHQLQKLGVK